MKKLLNSKEIYKGKIVSLYFDEVEYDGMNLKREVVRHRGGSAVLAKLNEKFAFVRQYRHPFGEEFFEIPAGTRDFNEDPKQTAYRELQEECGLRAKDLQLICEYAVSPGYTDEVLYLYYADEFDFVEQNFDEDEKLSVEWLSVQECIDMALNGKIKDGKTNIVLLWYALSNNAK